MKSDNLKVVERNNVSVIRKRNAVDDTSKIWGRFTVEHIRKGKVLNIAEVRNTIMNAAVNALWDGFFNGGSVSSGTAWKMGLISSASFSAIAAADLMNSHAGWTEFVSYSGGVRPSWGQGAAATRSVTNASPVTYTMTGSGTIKGLFIVNQSTLSGTTGVLWCAGLFTAGDAVVVTSDELRVTYAAGA